VAGLPPKISNLDSELNDIFSQLHDLDVSISNANHAIDELRESTKSIICGMLSKG
jgi:peptidoglycan hydrolase CwlO-like protein